MEEKTFQVTETIKTLKWLDENVKVLYLTASPQGNVFAYVTEKDEEKFLVFGDKESVVSKSKLISPVFSPDEKTIAWRDYLITREAKRHPEFSQYIGAMGLRTSRSKKYNIISDPYFSPCGGNMVYLGETERDKIKGKSFTVLNINEQEITLDIPPRKIASESYKNFGEQILFLNSKEIMYWVDLQPGFLNRGTKKFFYVGIDDGGDILSHKEISREQANSIYYFYLRKAEQKEGEQEVPADKKYKLVIKSEGSIVFEKEISESEYREIVEGTFNDDGSIDDEDSLSQDVAFHILTTRGDRYYPETEIGFDMNHVREWASRRKKEREEAITKGSEYCSKVLYADQEPNKFHIKIEIDGTTISEESCYGNNKRYKERIIVEAEEIYEPNEEIPLEEVVEEVIKDEPDWRIEGKIIYVLPRNRFKFLDDDKYIIYPDGLVFTPSREFRKVSSVIQLSPTSVKYYAVEETKIYEVTVHLEQK